MRVLSLYDIRGNEALAARAFAEIVTLSIIPALLLLRLRRYFVASLKTSGSKG